MTLIILLVQQVPATVKMTHATSIPNVNVIHARCEWRNLITILSTWHFSLICFFNFFFFFFFFFFFLSSSSSFFLFFNLIVSSEECCESTCETAFFGKSLTCPSGSVPKPDASEPCIVDASGACQASNLKRVNGHFQEVQGCCDITCASAMPGLVSAAKCGGNRAAAKSTSTDRCDYDECDENTCCPMLCENAGLTCSLPSEIPRDKQCSETSIDLREQCSVAAGGGCECVANCRAWGTNGGTCSNSLKILDTNTREACDENTCSEQICCIDPPPCGSGFKGAAITSACMCNTVPCGSGKYCFNPSDINQEYDPGSQHAFQCSMTAAPARCGSKHRPQEYSSFTCDVGTEKVEDDIANQCAEDNSCTKEKCCGPRTCTGKNIFWVFAPLILLYYFRVLPRRQH